MVDIGYKKNSGSYRELFGVVWLVVSRDRQQIGLLALVVLTIAFTAVASAVFPVLFSKGIDVLTGDTENVGSGVRYIIAFGVGFMVVGVLEQVQWLTFGPLNLKLQRHLTIDVFRHAISLPYYKLKESTTYEIGRTVEKGLDAIREIISNLTFFLLPTLIELLIAASVIAFLIDLWIATLLLTAMLAYGLIANFAAKRIRVSTEQAMDSGIEAWSLGLDGVANAELLQQSNLGLPYMTRLDTKLKINDRAWAVTFHQRAFYGALQALVFGAVVLGVLWRGGLGVEEGTLTIGELVLLNTYIIRLLQPVETFARVYRDVHASLGEARLLADLLSMDAPDTGWNATNTEGTKSGSLTVDVRDVSLAISEQTVLSGLSFRASPGQPLFVVGPSGVGKSSLLKLLSCLVIPSGGEYLINGVLITNSNSAKFRQDIAVVQQDCMLFDWSIRENIAFGYEGPEAEIGHVVEQLGLGDVVRRHEAQGMPTVGERGSRLSGGEKQRLSLARALLRRPNLLLLDEITSALDEVNRRRVLDTIRPLLTRVTCVFVTHDLGLLEPESRVLFISSPSSSRIGTHKELLRIDQSYSLFVAGIADHPDTSSYT